MSTDQKGIFIQLIFFYITIISQEKGIFLEIEYFKNDENKSSAPRMTKILRF